MKTTRRNNKIWAISSVALAFATAIILNACKHEPIATPVTDPSSYPDAVAKILVSKCATAGCHNALSYQNSSGILLDTWDHLFNGGNSGAIVIPYDTVNSTLLSFINTDTAQGLVQLPTMPLNAPPLSKEEYATMRSWIAAGAPDKNGNIPFADNADTRQKIYITAQGCDLMHVVDAERNVIMRNIQIGDDPGKTESPHAVRLSADGAYAYTSFIVGNWVQKIDTRTDKIVGQVQVSTDAGDVSGTGSQWNIINVSHDGTKVIAADYNKGQFKIINTASMQVTTILKDISNPFSTPHGMASNVAFDTIYVTDQIGNTVYKVSPFGYHKNILISNGAACNPHEIMLTPDESKYFLTCQGTNEVRVMDAHTDTLIAVIPVPEYPQELAISPSKHYMFVTCQEATNSTVPGAKGAVVVIDYNTMQIVSTIEGDFYQPHGITVDEHNNKVYIVSSNASKLGPVHHTTVCGGGLGWYSVYDLNTLQPINTRRYETSVFPYSADARFK